MLNKYENLDEVPRFEEIKKLPVSEAKIIMEQIRKNHTNSVLLRYWDIASGTFYNYLSKIGLHTPKNKKSKKEIILNENSTTNLDIDLLVEKLVDAIKIDEDNETGSIKKNFFINISGSYNKKEIEERLLNVAGILLDNKRYTLKLVMEEEII